MFIKDTAICSQHQSPAAFTVFKKREKEFVLVQHGNAVARFRAFAPETQACAWSLVRVKRKCSKHLAGAQAAKTLLASRCGTSAVKGVVGWLKQKSYASTLRVFSAQQEGDCSLLGSLVVQFETDVVLGFELVHAAGALNQDRCICPSSMQCFHGASAALWCMSLLVLSQLSKIGSIVSIQTHLAALQRQQVVSCSWKTFFA